MPKKTTSIKKRRLPPSTRRAKADDGAINATVAALDQMKPKSEMAAKTIALFKSWLADDSGYDEQVWPRLKKALDQERERAGARRLFDG